MQNLLQKISNKELLNLVCKILAKPGEVTIQDVIDLKEINSEFIRRDREFFAATQHNEKSTLKKNTSLGKD